jgi:glycosyltransferase involved in cell wall biosynthesis
VGRFGGEVPADLQADGVRTGFVEDDVLRLWLAAADVGLLVLRDTIASRGRWPGKLSDHLSGGVPLVLPDVGSAASYIAGAGAAHTCPPDAAAFARSVVSLLHDAPARARLSDRARALAAGDLSWARIARELLSFYAQWGSTGAHRAAARSGGRQAARGVGP